MPALCGESVLLVYGTHSGGFVQHSQLSPSVIDMMLDT
jgi:hypothetical protein